MMATNRNFGLSPNDTVRVLRPDEARHPAYDSFDLISFEDAARLSGADLSGLPSLPGGEPDLRARPARLSSRSALAARRPAFPIVYAIAGGALAAIAVVLLAFLFFLPRSEATAPVRSTPPAGPAHFLGKSDRLTMAVRP